MKENWRKTARHFHELTEKYTETGDVSRTLQIGPALQDAIDFWPVGRRFALDPLAVFYEREFGMRGREVRSIAAVGERLPLLDSCMDVVICQNVLDHVSDPFRVLFESRRVLRRKGLLFLGVNVFASPLDVEEGDDGIHFWRFAAADVKDALRLFHFVVRTEGLVEAADFGGANWCWLLAENNKNWLKDAACRLMLAAHSSRIFYRRVSFSERP